MKILNYGSLNIDYVYGVDKFVKEGETKSANSFNIFAGGKGLNQSIALCRAGLQVSHAGKIGKEGLFLKETLDKAGADTSDIVIDGGETGHAVIQVDKGGKNCITLHGGANEKITSIEIDRTLSRFGKGDVLVLQNEINNIPYIIEKAYKAGMKIAINPAPMNQKVKKECLIKAAVIVVNEIEGQYLSGKKGYAEILQYFTEIFKSSCIVLTLGKDGAMAGYLGKIYFQPIISAEVVDTTGAGDTFLGYFLASFLNDDDVQKALLYASKAAAITVSRKGAADSIPFAAEIK